MNITSTTVTKMATERTVNAYYELEYSVRENHLERVNTLIYTLPKTETEEKHHLGHITLENDNIHCSLSQNLQYAALFADFENFLTLIKAEGSTSEISLNTPKAGR